MQLPEAFLLRMQTQLGKEEYAAYLAAMDEQRPRALRVNTLKIGIDAFLSLAEADLTPCGIIPEGFFIPEGFEVGRNPLHAAGLFYMQEPSAQFPAALLHAQPHETVLDLCAAPGGKTGQLAAAMENTGLLIANEIVPSRAEILAGTLERLGARNAVITSMKPDALCPLLTGQCDAVLVDAPCSGEGMFRKEPQAVADWSEAHVETCAKRQQSILESAAPCVRPGGRLVYSTCTFSPAENEETVAAFLASHPDFTLIESHRFYPHTSCGEGQYAALLVRSADALPDAPAPSTAPRQKKGKAAQQPALKKALQKQEAAAREALVPILPAAKDAPLNVLSDGRILLLPERLPLQMDRMRVLRAGVLAGELKNGRFLPAHGLYLAYPKASFTAAVELEDTALTAFLAGETVPCDTNLRGYAAVCAKGHPVGFGKASDGTLKNHLPKGLRMR